MNKYLEKIAVTRLVEELAKGKVTMPLERLVAKGALRKPSVYANGMKEGNRAIAKKLGSIITVPKRDSISEILNNSGGGYTMMTGKHQGTLINVSNLGRSPKLKGVSYKSVAHQGAIRHELYEAMDTEAKRHSPHYQIDSGASHVINELNRHRAPVKVIDKYRKLMNNVTGVRGSIMERDGLSGPVQTGAHITPRVLTRESELVRKNPFLGHFKKMRSSTEESDIIQGITGKRYGKDKMTTRDHLTAFHAESTNMAYKNILGEYHPVFYPTNK